ncbi:MAG: hypothetical protein KKD28_00145 [Chloroflexi bacterium]|nr:hypothetical protein [Chloroflexota bacterium]
MTQDTLAGTNTYAYDTANRLTSVDGMTYAWDANGNLLNDGESTYTYNHANRLSSVVGSQSSSSYAYNGMGDRVSQTVDGETTTYTLDTAIGLTQVLFDGENAYLYGLGRIGEQGSGGWTYHHGDALGSVRQLTDESGVVTLVKGYQPYGDVLSSVGSGVSSYGFTGEWTDVSGMVYLRARYLDVGEEYAELQSLSPSITVKSLPTIRRLFNLQGTILYHSDFCIWAIKVINHLIMRNCFGEHVRQSLLGTFSVDENKQRVLMYNIRCSLV